MSTANEATAAFLMGEIHGTLDRLAHDFRIKVEYPEVIFDGTTMLMTLRFHDQTAIGVTLNLEGAPYKTCRHCGVLIYDDTAPGKEEIDPVWLSKAEDQSRCKDMATTHLPKEEQ